MKFFSGNSHPELSQSVVDHLGLRLGNIKVCSFSDGEVNIEILESVRGCDIIIMQSLSSPIHDHIFELLGMVDALRRASCKSITLVLPYFGYARQDRRVGSIRAPIMAKVMADMMAMAKIDRMLTLDIHSEAIQGFFNFPVDNLFATQVFIKDIHETHNQNLTVVSPDVGGVVRARELAKRLGDRINLAIIDKRRDPEYGTLSLNVVGQVHNQHCIVIDDLIDSGNTLIQAATSLKKHGALSVSAYVTHPVCSSLNVDDILQSDIDEMVVCNTISIDKSLYHCDKIRVLDVSNLLASAIKKIYLNQTLKGLSG